MIYKKKQLSISAGANKKESAWSEMMKKPVVSQQIKNAP